MPYTTTGKNKMLDALGVTHVSAHTAAPNESGNNEISSAGVYERQAISFTAASAAIKDSSSQPGVPIPAGTTVTHVGYWDSSTGGAFLGFSSITNESFGSDGVLTLTDVDLVLNDV